MQICLEENQSRINLTRGLTDASPIAGYVVDDTRIRHASITHAKSSKTFSRHYATHETI